jgi:carbamoyl-phosphate synthase large subunit
VVTKVPRFTFEKFPTADDRLTTQMKSVGEVMAIGRTFSESLQKALRGLEIGVNGLDPMIDLASIAAEDLHDVIERELRVVRDRRLWYVADAFRHDWTLEQVNEATKIDPWFLAAIEDIVLAEKHVATRQLADIDKHALWQLKRQGFSDARLADILGVSEKSVRDYRHGLNIRPVYKRVDSCAAEFATSTAYMYSTYEQVCESEPTTRDKIMVLGGGPNRIGQGIEFDYCCVHAALALRADGYETIMVNCNPETVSTDFDTSDRLYFEPVTLEDVLEIIHVESPKGVIVHYGGQTPLKLAASLHAEGAPIIGTSPNSIDLAEDRERFQQLIKQLGLKQPDNCTVRTVEEALEKADSIGFPLVVRPSYVLGGRAMQIVQNIEELQRYMTSAVSVSNESPVLLDRFLSDAIEVDVDAISDGERVVVGGIMEHIEAAGIHSGDSACSLPPYSLTQQQCLSLADQVEKLAKGLGVVGLMNTQFAIKDDDIYVLEVNPRAARTVPFVSKATGVSLAKVAARCMAGMSLDEQGVYDVPTPSFTSVKESVFPFSKFPGVDPLLGPEMKSTGEVMGSGRSFGEAFYKATLAASVNLPTTGSALLSVRDSDKSGIVEVAQLLVAHGFKVVATHGTAAVLSKADVPCEKINKLRQGQPHILDAIKNAELSLIINTTAGRQAIEDSVYIRQEALGRKIPYTTTLAGAFAICQALKSSAEGPVYRLSDLHEEIK